MSARSITTEGHQQRVANFEVGYGEFTDSLSALERDYQRWEANVQEALGEGAETLQGSDLDKREAFLKLVTDCTAAWLKFKETADHSDLRCKMDSHPELLPNLESRVAKITVDVAKLSRQIGLTPLERAQEGNRLLLSIGLKLAILLLLVAHFVSRHLQPALSAHDPRN